MLGKTLGSYKVVDKLGEGGMGAVYSAVHSLIGKRAAVKVLLPHFCHNKEIVERFFNEAKAATRIQHAGIIDIFDFGYAEDGSAFIVMEFLEGESLTDRSVRQGYMKEEDVLRIGRQIAAALSAAHRSGIIHRDLKPDNIFLISDAVVSGGERVKILDFGIAKLIGDEKEAVSKTRTGTVMGSPQYMSPEQCKGSGSIDARTDVYALGCVLYHMVCGQPPFDANGVGEVLAKHIYEEPPRPRGMAPNVSAGMEEIILRCLQKKPEDRFQSMDELVAAIDEQSGGRLAMATPKIAIRTDHKAGPLSPTEPPLAVTPIATRPQENTTLSGAARAGTSHPSPPRGKKTGTLAAVAVLAIGVTAVALYFKTTQQQPESPVAAVETMPSKKTASASTSASTSEKPAPEKPAPAPVPPAPTEPPYVELKIESTPPGADVLDSNNRFLGKTPITLNSPKSSTEISFSLSRSGYQTVPVTLVPDENRNQSVTLLKVQARTAPVRRPPTTESKPKDATKGSSEFGKTSNPFD